MAFSIFGFQFNRGITTANAQGQAFTAVPHTYKSNVDTLAQIASPGYFPINIEGTPTTDKVFVHDWLFIVDKNGATSFVNITGLNPVTLSPDLFTATGLTVIAPTSAVDTNGIIISGTNIQLEFADGTHPGILSAAAQTIGGIKTFPNGVHSNNINGVLVGDQMFIGTNQTATITIGNNTGAPVFVPGTVITDRIASASGGLSISTNMDGVTIIGQDTASTTTGILTNRIDTISPGGNPLVIGAASVFPVTLGNGSTPILVKGGVKWDIGGATISSWNQLVQGISWSGPWGSGQASSMTLNKIENIVYMTITRAAPQAVTTGSSASTGPVIPAAFRPTQQVEFIMQNVSNSAYVAASGTVTTTGIVFAFGTAAQGAFAATGTAGVGDITQSWSTVFP